MAKTEETEMNDTANLDRLPVDDRTRRASISGSAKAAKSGTLAVDGHMILEDVKGWLGSREVREIVGRWVPDGSELGELGATMAVAFSSGEPDAGEQGYPPSSETADWISDEFAWLNVVNYHSTAEGLAGVLPWSGLVPYRHPIVGRGEVDTLRSCLGAPWKKGGEVHVTFDDAGHPDTVELRTGFWSRVEVDDALKWLSGHLSFLASPACGIVFDTVSEGDEARIAECWWSTDRAHYQIFCTFGDETSSSADSGTVPHYVTVRKFLLPVEPRQQPTYDAFADCAEEPTMEEVLASIREIISEDDAPDAAAG